MKTTIIEGFQVNPKTPKYMDLKPIDERCTSHLDKWLYVPFIRTQSFETETYESYKKRISDLHIDIKLETKEEFNQRIENSKKEWYKHWFTGVRYDVRCLDYGAWDRTTNRGSFATLQEAINKCKKMCE